MVSDKSMWVDCLLFPFLLLISLLYQVGVCVESQLCLIVSV